MSQPVSNGPPYFGLPPGDRVEFVAGVEHRAWENSRSPYFRPPPGERVDFVAGGQQSWISCTPANTGRPQQGPQPRRGGNNPSQASNPRPRFNSSWRPNQAPTNEDDGDDEEEYDEEGYDEDEKPNEDDEGDSYSSPPTQKSRWPRGIRATNRRHLVALHEMYAARPRDNGRVKKYRVSGASPFRHIANRGPAFKWACKELKVRDWEWDEIMEGRQEAFPGGFHMEWREDGTPEGGNWYVVGNVEGMWDERRDRVNRKGGPRGGPGKRGNPNGFPRGGKRGSGRGGPRGGGVVSAR